MAIRNIFIPILQGVPFRTQLDAALRLGARDPVHINAVFIRSDPAVVVASIPDMLIAAGVTIEHIEGEGRAAEAEARAEFEAWSLSNTLKPEGPGGAAGGSSASWREQVGSISSIIVEIGRISDLTILHRPETHDTATYKAFDAAVFETGRPVLILPDKMPKDLLHHIVVAWNSSIEATRVVAGAMPLLSAADHVSIFTAPTHTGEALRDIYLGEQLAWHGIRAMYLAPVIETESIGAALLKVAGDQQATMLVMGAYTHTAASGKCCLGA